jgi:hypothetical protein
VPGPGAQRGQPFGDALTLLECVQRLLDVQGIAHALIGAAALAAHGIARSTLDLDLLVTDARASSPTCGRPCADGALVDVRRGDASDALGGIARIEAEEDRPVDVVLGKWAWQARALQRAEHIVGGPPVVAARDLVLLKLYAGRRPPGGRRGRRLRRASRVPWRST